MSNVVQSLIEHLALATARGPRQVKLIHELLANEQAKIYPQVIWTKPDPTSNISRRVRTRTLGSSRLPWSSWINLRKRLEQAGFLVEEQDKIVTVIHLEQT